MSFDQSSHEKELDLDQQLEVYFGPKIAEQRLSAASWDKLQSRLGPQKKPVKWYLGRWKTEYVSLSREAQETFMRISYEAGIPVAATMLTCNLSSHYWEPEVRLSVFPRPHMTLCLPVREIEQSLLEFLLATALARYQLTYKKDYLFWWCLFFLLAVAGLLFLLIASWHAVSLFVFPLSLFCWVLASILLVRQKRRMILQADQLTCHWLGRENTCEGLHLLLSLSKRPKRRRWGEPSLHDRMRFVSGVQDHVKDKHFSAMIKKTKKGVKIGN